jgi:hypothetical protein
VLRGALVTVLAAVFVTGPVQSAEPNMEGVWKIATPTSTLKPISGEVPFTARGKKAYAENKKLRASKKYDDYDITRSRCSNPGVPRLMLTPKRFKIWIRQKMMTFDFEWNRAIRQIDLRGLKFESLLVPNMTGISTGRWEGDTLVATTTDLSDRTLIDDLTPHGYDLKVTERYELLDANTLENRITIEDPEYFTKPWEAVVTYKRQPDALLPEDVCLDRIQAKTPAPAWP